MPPVEKDIIAVLLKSAWEHGLIPEPTYHMALSKLFCTLDAGNSIGYDSVVNPRRTT